MGTMYENNLRSRNQGKRVNPNIGSPYTYDNPS